MARWKPSYYETPDEKRLAAIRANPTGLPVRQVRPMLPNNFDATGGSNKWGAPNASIPQYLENNRKMYTMGEAPSAVPAPASRWEAPGIGGALAVNAKYGTPGGVNNLGSFPAVGNFTANQSRPPSPVARPVSDAWSRKELQPAMDMSDSPSELYRHSDGNKWGTALDKVPVSVSARGPASIARQRMLLSGGRGRRNTGYGGYQ